MTMKSYKVTVISTKTQAPHTSFVSDSTYDDIEKRLWSMFNRGRICCNWTIEDLSEDKAMEAVELGKLRGFEVTFYPKVKDELAEKFGLEKRKVHEYKYLWTNSNGEVWVSHYIWSGYAYCLKEGDK